MEIKFKTEWVDAMNGLPPEKRCEIYEAVVAYSTSGTVPEMSPEAALVFGAIRHEVHRVAGRKVFTPDLSFVDERLSEAFNSWLEYKRTEIRDSYKTQKGVSACYAHLMLLSGGDIETAKKIIAQSIANRWKGLFALKGGAQRMAVERSTGLPTYKNNEIWQ